MVYRDVGIPLHKAEDLPTAFNAIQETVLALVLMFLAGWLHRDVSTGNIILVPIPGKEGKYRALLSDL